MIDSLPPSPLTLPLSLSLSLCRLSLSFSLLSVCVSVCQPACLSLVLFLSLPLVKSPELQDPHTPFINCLLVVLWELNLLRMAPDLSLLDSSWCPPSIYDLLLIKMAYTLYQQPLASRPF